VNYFGGVLMRLSKIFSFRIDDKRYSNLRRFSASSNQSMGATMRFLVDCYLPKWHPIDKKNGGAK
jgi:hypothetical protein